MLKKEQIEKNIDWLLKSSTPPVMYLIYKYLLKVEDSELISNLWKEVKDSPEVKEIFGKQEKDGSWCAGGSWASDPTGIPKGGYSAFTPKYNTTIWVLSILGDMGFTVNDERIRKAFDYTLTYQLRNGLFSRYKQPLKSEQSFKDSNPENTPCELGVFLIGLGKIGGGDISELEKSYLLLQDFQRDDGGWVRERHRKGRHWTRSCPWSSFHAAAALYYSRNPEYKESFIKGLEFLVWHLFLKTDHEIQRFFYHGHSTVHELLMLSEYGIDLDRRPVKSILEWLKTMYDEDEGCFHYRGKPPSTFRFRQDYMSPGVAKYRLHHLIEDDWLTYYVTRIAVNILNIRR